VNARKLHPRALAAAVVTWLALMLLAACGGHTHPDTPGTVVAREVEEHCHKAGRGSLARWPCTSRYEITTKARTGRSHEFKVTRTVYSRCHGGDSYPRCAGH
jgi:cytochrome c1